MERTLLISAFIITILGLVILFILTNTTDFKVKKINETKKGDFVYIQGIVKSVSIKGKVLYMQLIQPSTIDVVAFENPNIAIKEGDKIFVLGKIDKWEGKKQVIADEIIKVE